MLQHIEDFNDYMLDQLSFSFFYDLKVIQLKNFNNIYYCKTNIILTKHFYFLTNNERFLQKISLNFKNVF